MSRKDTNEKAVTIDEYISAFPEQVQIILQKVRQTIGQAAPQTTEVISYGMPAFRLHDTYLVGFAGWKDHVGLYPTPAAIEQFRQELSSYKQAKGSVRFPLDAPIPYELIARIVLFRIQQIANT